MQALSISPGRVVNPYRVEIDLCLMRCPLFFSLRSAKGVFGCANCFGLFLQAGQS
jgi:hypothetical protein